MKDGIDGHRHRYIVPAGRVGDGVWKSLVEEAHTIPFPTPLLGVMDNIQRPFIQLTT